jgi:hypothetical protein
MPASSHAADRRWRRHPSAARRRNRRWGVASEEQQHHSSIAAMDDQRLVEGQIRQRQLEALDFLEVDLLLGDLVLQARLRRRIGRFRQLCLEGRDLAGRAGELILQPRPAERAQVLAGRLEAMIATCFGNGIGLVWA